MSDKGATPYADLMADQKRAITVCHSLVSEELNNTGLLDRNPGFHLADPANAIVYGTTVWFEAVGLKTFTVQALKALLSKRNKNLDMAWAEEAGVQKVYVTLDFADYATRVSKSTGSSTTHLLYQFIVILILCLIVGIIFQTIS